MTRPDLKAEVWAELRRGQGIREAYLSDVSGRTHVHGLCLGEAVYVNPVPSTLDTCIHELIHRLHPRYGEARVQRETKRIMKTLSDREIRRWYTQYTKAAQPAEALKVTD